MTEKNHLKGIGIAQITSENLENTSGGHISNTRSKYLQGLITINHGSPIDPWAVVDKRGNIVYRTTNKEDATSWAQKNGFSTNEVTWKEIKETREFFSKKPDEAKFF